MPVPASTPIRATLRQLQIFLAVAGRGTTTGAAADLALSQSATSAALNELEALLGTRLFDRVGKRLALNDGGRTLLPQARRLVEGAQALEARFREDDGAEPFRLQVGASTTIGNYVLPPLVASFMRDHPAGRLDLRIGNTEDVASAVAGFTVDIGFIEGPCHEREMQTLPWMTDELVIVAAASHPLAARARRGKIPVSALRQALWLLREPGSGTRDAVLQALLPHLTQLRSPVELGSTEAIKAGASAGLGLACLSRLVVEDFIALGRLVELRTPLPPLRRGFSLLLHEQKFVSPAMERFIAHCRSAVRDGAAVQVPVVVGAKLGDPVAIDGNVKSGDRVVQRPPADLASGARVRAATR